MPIGEALSFIESYLKETEIGQASGIKYTDMNPLLGFTPKPGVNPPFDSESGTPGMIVSLINIEEEKSLKQPYKYERIANTQPALIAKMNPDIDLNLYVLFTAFYGNYADCLTELSEVIKIFASKNVFNRADIEFYLEDESSLSKIILDLHTMSLDEMSNLWQGLGSNFYPSVMYKVRVITIKPEVPVATTTEIVSLSIES